MGYTCGRRLTKEFVLAEAKKYRCRSEFQKHDSSCYCAARVGGYLTVAVIKEIAKQYSTRTAFKNGNKSAYGRALKIKIMDELFGSKEMPSSL